MKEYYRITYEIDGFENRTETTDLKTAQAIYRNWKESKSSRIGAVRLLQVRESAITLEEKNDG